MNKDIKDVIDLAIRGGYLNHITKETTSVSHLEYDKWDKTFMICDPGKIICTDPIPVSTAALDPLFWQALGKELGWEIHDNEVYLQNGWEKRMLGMVRHIIDGGNIEDYLISLIK